jgi:hypothetical protein
MYTDNRTVPFTLALVCFLAYRLLAARKQWTSLPW